MEKRIVIDLKHSVWSRHGEEPDRLELLTENVRTVPEKAGMGSHTDVLAEVNGRIFGLISP